MKRQQDQKSIQFELQLYNNHHELTFSQKFYIEDGQDYTEVLKQISEILKSQNIDIYLQELAMAICGGRMNNEKFIVVKKVD